jgi:hypothetical protein
LGPRAATGRPAASTPYRRSQFGTPIAIGTGFGVVLATIVLLSVSKSTLAAAPWLAVALYAVLVAPLALFGRLTVTVDAGRVLAVFGIGLVRKEVRLSEIRGIEIGTARRWWGYGVRWTPSGWLYNVAGRNVVRLELATERPVMIGSDEPEALAAAIQAGVSALESQAAGKGR